MGTNERASTPGLDPDRDPGEGAGARPDRADWGGLLATHRDRLRRMVALRLDERLRGRVDPSDVIQEAFLEATRRQAEYARNPAPMPPFLELVRGARRGAGRRAGVAAGAVRTDPGARCGRPGTGLCRAGVRETARGFFLPQRLFNTKGATGA